MDPAQVREWTEKYLKLYQCPVIESGPSYLITQLSIEADKDLLNRPFYWMYVEKMNIPPKPVQLCFIFDPENHPPDIRGKFCIMGPPVSKKCSNPRKNTENLSVCTRIPVGNLAIRHPSRTLPGCW